MKKVIDFLKWPLTFPISILGALYIYWFLSSPMDFDSYDDNFYAFVLGMILFIVFIFITVLLRLSRKNWVLFRLSLFFVLPLLIANVIYYIAYFPIALEKAEFGNFRYYIVSTEDSDFHSLELFYKCEKWGFNCDGLYRSYCCSLGPLIIDEQKQEISLLGSGGSALLYTDGENPRSYTRPGAQFEDHLYQFSEECNDFNNKEGYYTCDSYTYILYECNLDYKSCNSLPIQYTTEDFDTLLFIKGNEETKEINIYSDYLEDGGVLMFTYGENPRCYVEGCEILEP